MAIYDVHPRIKAATLDVIQGLNLQGDGTFDGIAERVYSQLFPDETGLKFPCVILTTEGEKEQLIERDTDRDRWKYPVRIWIADRESERKHEKETLYLIWRKTIIVLLDGQSLNGVHEADPGGCSIAPEVIFDQKLPQYQHIVSGMVLWVQTTEPRQEN